MCLLSIAFNKHPDYPLVFIGNRDEYHARETAAADWWDRGSEQSILAGRDLQAGGTWLGINRTGRFSVVTNRPDLPPPDTGALSRGELIVRWLDQEDIQDGLADTHSAYGGFSLLLCDSDNVQLLNGGNGSGQLQQQTFSHCLTGLSNTAIDNPWPKLTWLNNELERVLDDGVPDVEALLALLARREPVPGAISHGVPATPFVVGDTYGTRCSTVISVDNQGNCDFVERRFGPGGADLGQSRYRFTLDQP